MQTPETKTKFTTRLLPKSLHSRLLVLVVGGAIVIAALAFYHLALSLLKPPTALPPPPQMPATSVTALGRLEPQGEVIRLAASGSGSRVGQLLVRQGASVKAGQTIAILDSDDRLKAALAGAQRQVQVAKAKLAQVQAGAKLGNINAQAADVIRLEAELNNAQMEYQRYQQLYQAGGISASLLDSKRLIVETTNAQIQEAKQTLQSVKEVRPVDIQLAQAEVEDAIAAVQQAQAELNLAYIRSPQNGQILSINTRAGEIIGTDGIVELGQSNQMYAVAEVYEDDIQRVHLGQSAAITSTAFTGTVHGTVDEIGLQVRKKDVLDTDPTAAVDARVIEVKIRLNPEGTRQVRNLSNLQVTVQIAI